MRGHMNAKFYDNVRRRQGDSWLSIKKFLSRYPPLINIRYTRIY